MVSAEELYGNARFDSISANLQLRQLQPRLRMVSATAGSLKVLLPDAQRLRIGGWQYIVCNIGTQTFSVADFSGNDLISVAANQVAILNLIANATAAGQWLVSGRLLFGGPNSGLVTLRGIGSIGVGHTGNITILGTSFFKGTLSAGTTFTGKLSFPSTRELKGVLSIGFAPTGKFAVFPTTKIVSPSATGSGDGSVGNPWTLKQAATAAAPGDTIYLRGGVYVDAANHVIDSINSTVVSGTSGNVIHYTAYPGEIPEINGTFRLFNSQYLKFSKIKFQSSGKRWITTTSTAGGAQRNLEWEGCEFDSAAFVPGSAGAAFTGITLQNGRDYKFKGCKFGRWYGGDLLAFIDAEHILVENCDWSQSGAPHMLLGALDCGYVYIRNSFFRNPWGRVMRVGRHAGGIKKYALVEDCLIADSNWNRIDAHPGDGENLDSAEWGDTESVRLQMEGCILRNCIIAGHNVGELDNTSGQPFSFSCGVEIHYFDDYTSINNVRVYNNVVHKSNRCALAFLYNTSAGTIAAAGHKFRNNNFTEFELYGIFVTHSILPWEGWLFEKNRVYDPTKTKTIFLEGETTELLTVAQAESFNSTVFKSNVTTVPAYFTQSLYETYDADPTKYDIDDLPAFFDAFSSNTPTVGKELAEVTQNGTTVTTINVDDSYWFMPATDYYAGDKVYIGTDLVTITAIPSATQLTVTPAITVAIGDKIYLERMMSNPPIGLIPLLSKAAANFASSNSIDTGFTGKLKSDFRFIGSLSLGTGFTGKLDVAGNILAEFNFETQDLSEFTSTNNPDDLMVQAAAALKGTYGLKATIDASGVAYGERSFTWTSQYLRFRVYLDPNTITMVNGEDFYVVEFRTAGGQSSGYLRLAKTSGVYKVFAAQRKDDGVYGATAQYTISDASHYIEVEFKRAASAVSVDGETSLWIDGTLQETVTGLDVFDVARPTRVLYGAVNGIDPSTAGSFYTDALIVKSITGIIGA